MPGSPELNPEPFLCYHRPTLEFGEVSATNRDHSLNITPAAIALAAHRPMRNFSRALKLALCHRVKIATCIFTSVVIAVLWGGNLTAVFPVVEVIMNDHALPDWIDQKIAESQVEINDSHHWLAQLEKLKSSSADEIQHRVRAEIDRRQAELTLLRKKAAGTWDDVQIAEKTRLDNDIKHLDALAKAPADNIGPKLSQEVSDTEHHLKVYMS